MKFYLIEAYKDIPQYAEVEVIDWGQDSGYEIYNVKYLGRDYKPLRRDVMSEREIKETFEYYSTRYNLARATFNKTVGAKK